MMKRPLLLAILGALVSLPAHGDDAAERESGSFSHWRGPLANGFWPSGDPPTHWDEKTNVRWKADLPGLGSSTPIVWGEQIFVLTALDTDRKADEADLPQ